MKSKAKRRAGPKLDYISEFKKGNYGNVPLGSLLITGLEIDAKIDAMRDSYPWPWRLLLLAVSACALLVLGSLGLLSILLSMPNKFLIMVASLVPKRATLINQQPGALLLRLAELLYATGMVERTFKPIVADWRTEYFEALEQGRILKARCVSARYAYSFIMAMCLSKTYSFLRRLTSAGR